MQEGDCDLAVPKNKPASKKSMNKTVSSDNKPPENPKQTTSVKALFSLKAASKNVATPSFLPSTARATSAQKQPAT